MNITSEVSNLKDCPFCGGHAEFYERDHKYEGSGVFSMQQSCGCFKCGVMFTHQSKFTVTGPKVTYIEDGFSYVIDRWNDRATERG